MPLLPPALCAWTPGTLVSGGSATLDPRLSESMVRAAEAARRGGVMGLLLREPHLGDGAFLALAHRLREVFDGAWFGVHDRVHLAAEVGADGVHLGGDSLDPQSARTVVGGEMALGVSAHVEDDPRQYATDADEQPGTEEQDVPRGVDYVAYAPVFAPNSKGPGRAPLGVDALLDLCARCPRPVVALGGLNAERIAELVARGSRGGAAPHGFALIGGLWGTDATPLTGQRSPLDDPASIQARADALSAAAAPQAANGGRAR